LNYAAKHSSMSAKPNHSLKKSAAAMNSHKQMKNMDRQYQRLQRSNSTPLFVDGQTSVHNMDCFAKLVPIAQHMLIEQMEQGQSHYMALQLTPTSFAVIRETAPDTGALLGCPESFKGRPKFRTANIVTKQDSTSGNPPILVCSCGLKAQNGIICRHLFALQTDYDIHDIACRWHTSYNLHAYEEGQGPITRVYEQLQQIEHSGVTFKRICSTYNDQDLATTDGVYPRMIVAGKKILSMKNAMAIVNSSVPICWNYAFAEYPAHVTLHEFAKGVTTLFTQEYGILETEFAGFKNEDCIDASQELELNAEELMRVQPRFNFLKARAMLQQKFKELDRILQTSEQANFCLAGVQQIEAMLVEQQSGALTPAQRASFLGDETNPNGTISYCLPTDNSKKSTQNTYHRKKGAESTRKRKNSGNGYCYLN